MSSHVGGLKGDKRVTISLQPLRRAASAAHGHGQLPELGVAHGRHVRRRRGHGRRRRGPPAEHGRQRSDRRSRRLVAHVRVVAGHRRVAPPKPATSECGHTLVGQGRRRRSRPPEPHPHLGRCSLSARRRWPSSTCRTGPRPRCSAATATARRGSRSRGSAE